MNSRLNRIAPALFATLFALAALFVFSPTQLAQTNVDLPARTGHVSDFAAVFDDAARQQLESTLENFKQKTGIQFDIATVQDTSGIDISDFSQRLAQNWKLIGKSSKGRNVLLVVSIKDGTSFTQFSTGVPSKLPEGIFGEIGQRLRSYLSAGKTADGLVSTVEYFTSTVARQQGVDLNQPAVAASDSPSTVAAAPANTPEPVINTPTNSKVAKSEATPSEPDDADESEEVELTLTKSPADRVAALKNFLDVHANSPVKRRAVELLVGARAAYGDQLLQQGDNTAGVAQMMLAISEAPLDASDKLFSGVIAQIPLNLFLRREVAAAETAARAIATRFANDPKKLLAAASYFVTVERGEEARKIAEQALRMAPDLPEAHQALAMALHVSLRLPEASEEYRKALQLDPNLKGARRSLADLARALGHDDEALELYKAQLTSDANDKSARAGMIISLFNLGRDDEAKTALDAALKADANNLPLLASTAYWFAAHKEYDLAIALGTKAVELQPRYTWSQIAIARALIAKGNPLAAERAIRFARLYAKFPTLDYELANTLAASGLFEEAAEVLSQKFRIKNDQIETLLGGHTPAQAASFIELLAPERQASIFQMVAPETESNAKVLKDLLVFNSAINPSEGVNINEAAAVAAAKEFASGSDAARAFRELYAASRLLQKGIGYQTAFDLAEAARTSADAALTVPALTLAVQADEYRASRAQAIAAGATPDIAEAPANMLSNILRGRIEDISGWALFNLDKTEDAVDHLKRAVSIIPDGTPLRRTTLWHLGAALERQGSNDEALSYYIRSYNAGEPDALRRSIIEKLYRRVNGSLEGLEEKIGAQASAAVNTPSVIENPPVPARETAAPQVASSDAVASPSPTPETASAIASPTPSETVKEEPQPAAPPAPSATPTETPSPSPEVKAQDVPVTVPTTLTVSGVVRDQNDAAMPNAVVVLISSQGTVLTTTTDERGAFTFTVAPSATGYRIIPSRNGYVFEPVDRVIASLAADVTQINFTGKRQ